MLQHWVIPDAQHPFWEQTRIAFDRQSSTNILYELPVSALQLFNPNLPPPPPPRRVPGHTAGNQAVNTTGQTDMAAAMQNMTITTRVDVFQAASHHVGTGPISYNQSQQHRQPISPTSPRSHPSYSQQTSPRAATFAPSNNILYPGAMVVPIHHLPQGSSNTMAFATDASMDPNRTPTARRLPPYPNTPLRRGTSDSTPTKPQGTSGQYRPYPPN
ncbi:hypothetical protein ARMSODRAFT_381735 [Armillaria solidipes]|uniref:Uncharacterized protein n=1 Tax=Armillaria solidipes TaxID=1076256 RepID=A0A2H3BS76_9AGAR|nr:hypothetical protein ARMSODRAFT_381735 [Armillaria solidipes]